MRNSIVAFSMITFITFGALPAFAENFKKVKTANEFNALVVGKKIVWDAGTGMVHADGSTDGKLKKHGKYVGNWMFSKGFYCSNLVINKKETGTNCQVVEVDGNKLRLTRDKGKGKARVYSLQ